MDRKIDFRPTWPQYESSLIKFEQLELIDHSQRIKIRLLLDSYDENSWNLAKSMIQGLHDEISKFYDDIKNNSNLNGYIKDYSSGEHVYIPHAIITNLELRQIKIPQVNKVISMLESEDSELNRLGRTLIEKMCNEKKMTN